MLERTSTLALNNAVRLGLLATEFAPMTIRPPPVMKLEKLLNV